VTVPARVPVISWASALELKASKMAAIANRGGRFLKCFFMGFLSIIKMEAERCF
jgi:hypothetical protein